MERVEFRIFHLGAGGNLIQGQVNTPVGWEFIREPNGDVATLTDIKVMRERLLVAARMLLVREPSIIEHGFIDMDDDNHHCRLHRSQ